MPRTSVPEGILNLVAASGLGFAGRGAIGAIDVIRNNPNPLFPITIDDSIDYLGGGLMLFIVSLVFATFVRERSF